MNGGFFGSALSNIGLVLFDGSLQFNNDLLPLSEFTLVDFDFVFKLDLVVSSSGVGVDFVFLGLSNLSVNGVF